VRARTHALEDGSPNPTRVCKHTPYALLPIKRVGLVLRPAPYLFRRYFLLAAASIPRVAATRTCLCADFTSDM